MEAVYRFVKQLIYFILLVGMLRNLAGRKYEKYARLTVGLCLVLIIAAPVLSFFSGEDIGLILERNDLLTSVSLEASSSGGSGFEEDVLQEYEHRMLQQMQELLKEYGVEPVRLEYRMENGCITGFDVWVSREEGIKESGQKDNSAVETVSITQIVVLLSEMKEQEEPDNPLQPILETRIRKRLADFYNMDVTHINVIIGGIHGSLKG